MGDHKCMNEYYPPDFDPTKLPRLRSIPGQGRDKILEIRTMLPWNIRCNTCGHYMHRGTKFNARVEAATDKPKYLEYVTIRRFYMTCTNCISTITFLTDPEAVVSITTKYNPDFEQVLWFFLGLCYGIRSNTFI